MLASYTQVSFAQTSVHRAEDMAVSNGFRTSHYCASSVLFSSVLSGSLCLYVCVDVITIMEEKHKALITKNYVSLVERTSLSDLLPLLIEKNVLTQEMAEKFMVNLIDVL